MKRPLEGFQVASQHVLLLALRCAGIPELDNVRTLPPCGSSLHKKIYYILYIYTDMNDV